MLKRFSITHERKLNSTCQPPRADTTRLDRDNEASGCVSAATTLLLTLKEFGCTEQKPGLSVNRMSSVRHAGS